MALTLKIFMNEPSPNYLEIFTVKILKIYIYLMMVVSFLFATPIGIVYIAENDNMSTADYFGVRLIYYIN
jgi:hypothetical protein